MNNNITVLGPGITTLDFSPSGEEKILAFQEVFPHCLEKISVIPDYWFSADPSAYLGGLSFLLNNQNVKELKKIKILVPSVFTKDFDHYRKYCGTTPLMRINYGWSIFHSLLLESSKLYETEIIPVTTSKFIKISGEENFNEVFSNCGKERFNSEKVIFGTVEFDSESVIGDRYKWGLENKLTSTVLPMCHHLGATTVKIFGFDYQGPRFYSDIERHPWNDETQEGNSVVDFSLSLLKKWKSWEHAHGMEIVSGTNNKISLINNILEFKK